ncbi:unannotated protein [freshwater metagenome]|uniref:Unannotated protein n=1 Tax=freshwater metagenome TaxID=449393 RepID=A0A6J7JMU6_9ZZZZ|nr:hypothetical protein [Actinomycetota bacterium]
MDVAPEFEEPRASASDAFSDAVTISFGDLERRVYGTVRLGLAGGTQASGLVVLFHGDAIATVSAEGGLPVADASTWAGVQAAGIDLETVEPLRSWRCSFAGDEASFDLELEACGPPGALDDRGAVAKLGGMAGYEQPVRVRGSADIGGTRVRIDGLGQRGRSWGEPDWSGISRTRTVGAWFDDHAVTIAAIAKDGADGHGSDAIAGTLFAPGPEGSAVATTIGDPRLSTTFDGEGRQRRATFELWVTDDGPPIRAAAEVLCGTTLDLGRLRLDTALLRWAGSDGEPGVGRYDVLRRADD